ncbi:MAG: hypothetical protein CMB99_00615 [Flavobacteriaceae bacterium]|jgi:hypothetical protein|nr:hypothetical protein [Flavobacteriaceae bacterium]|tara:strand:- start:3322 stop:3777 length:456 start_codon:yes stop_codon:yes gene_type:complete
MGNAMTEAHRDEDLYGERHDEKPTPAPAKNPKTAIGRTKPAMVSVIPTASLLHLGEVMKLGATKYGPFNWRETPVPAEVYVDAAMRHLLSWFDGEDRDPESGMSHLGHVMACCAIIIDAQENGMLDDNRPKAGRVGQMIANFQDHGDFNDS